MFLAKLIISMHVHWKEPTLCMGTYSKSAPRFGQGHVSILRSTLEGILKRPCDSILICLVIIRIANTMRD